MVGLQEKNTYISVLIPFISSEAKDVLQKKATKGAIIKIVREIASWTRLNLILKISTLTFTNLLLCDENLSFLYSEDVKKFSCNFK